MQQPTPSSFGALLRETRLARGVALSELARRVGVAKSVVFAWEAGRALPGLARLHLVVHALRGGQDVGWRLVVAAGAPTQERAAA